MDDLLIEKGLVITLDKTRRIIQEGSVAVKDGKVVAVDKAETVARTHSARKVIPCNGKVILPGFVNAHVHTLEQLERGMADEIDIFPWVFKKTLPYEAALTPEEIHFSSLLCCAEMIKSGTTTIAEVGAHPLHYDATAQAIEESGLRAVIGKHGMDSPSSPVPPPLFETTDQCITSAEALIKKWHNRAGGRLRGSVVVTTLRAGTKELFQRSKKLADDWGVILQVHMNPGTGGGFVEEMMKTHGACHVAYLDQIGALGKNVLLVHMSYPTTDEEVEMMRTREAKVCHCPGAALHGGYGVSLAKIPELLSAGVDVGLGSDGAPSCNFNDMVRIMYLAAGIHKDVRLDPTIMPPETVLEMATLHGARALLWEEEIGSLEVGKRADLAIFNVQRPEWQPLLNPVSNLVYSATGDSCETVIIDGAIVMEGGKLLTINEEDLIAKATPMAQAIMERAGLDRATKWPIV